MSRLNCLQKQDRIKKIFLKLSSQEAKYHYIIEIGRKTAPMPVCDQTEERLVLGCQSLLYLKVECDHGRLCLQVSSNALISAGLASLLIQVYQGESPETVFECPPLFLKEIGLLSLLSPSRSNGVKSLYQQLQRECLRLIEEKCP